MLMKYKAWQILEFNVGGFPLKIKRFCLSSKTNKIFGICEYKREIFGICEYKRDVKYKKKMDFACVLIYFHHDC